MTRYAAPRGTYDLLPEQAAAHQRLEAVCRSVFARFGYGEIRVPVFEYTRLFNRGVGETTDIVEKQMFTFGTGGDEEKDTLSLRPELTAGVMRALIEHNVLAQKPFVKVWYYGPVFRKERPQKGRFRQFHQFGVEAVGSNDPLVDVETILVLLSILREAGVQEFQLKLNSVGCPECRPRYRETLRAAAQAQLPQRCEDCRRRFERNVLRLLDCKTDRELNRQLPGPMEHVCPECRRQFELVQKHTGGVLEPTLVRGLDYYTRTVYEVTSSTLGAQDALAGGGRYDHLVEELGGPKVGGVGFAAGVERVVMSMKEVNAGAPLDFFGIYIDETLKSDLFDIVNRLRGAGLSGDMELETRSVKAQMRNANRSGARFAVILGGEERQRGVVKLKDMARGHEREVTIDEAIRIVGAR